MKNFRLETDMIGNRELPEDVLYGIHALRAKENFPDHTAFPYEWYKAVGVVKQACYETYQTYKKAVSEKFPGKELPFPLIPDNILEAIHNAAKEVAEGKYFDQFIVPAFSGGAGTSINMNVNEIIANVALIKLGKKPGRYELIDPVEHANVFQSTNDVIPTALRVAVMTLLNQLEETINLLRMKVEAHENTHRSDLRIGYTQMQEAVPSSFGKLFSTYSESLSRDWWRVSKCFERIKALRDHGCTILLVTHDTTAVQNICDRALWLDAGQAKRCGTNVAEIVAEYMDFQRARATQEDVPAAQEPPVPGQPADAAPESRQIGTVTTSSPRFSNSPAIVV